jgi:translation initiation factor IF-2
MANISVQTQAICGAVNTDKTKLLNKIWTANIKEGEVGSIMQQTGAMYFKQ